MSISVVVSGGILTVLTTDKNSYSPGEPVRITLSKQNISARPIVLSYPTSQRYDFSVRGINNTVWQWSADKTFAAVVGQIYLEPGQGLSYTETWGQKNNQGQSAPPGFYRITGWNTFTGFTGYPIPSTFVFISR